MITREHAIETIVERHANAIYVATTGFISRAMYGMFPDNKNIFYMKGSMGLAPAIALGMALNTDKQVVVISGDASLLMHLGITHTIRDANCQNLFHYVLDNGCHESVGGFPCSSLEERYPGVTDIIRITKSDKNADLERIDLSFPDNCQQIQEYCQA